MKTKTACFPHSGGWIEIITLTLHNDTIWSDIHTDIDLRREILKGKWIIQDPEMQSMRGKGKREKVYELKDNWRFHISLGPDRRNWRTQKGDKCPFV